MGAALVLLLVGLGALAAGVLIGRYYVPDDRQLRRTARHSRSYMRALSHLIARDHDTAISELRTVVEENVDETEPYFALGALFRSRGEHERAIRVHQALAVRERDKRKLRQRAMYELGLDFRAAGMPRRATRAMEEVVLEEPGHEGALRVLAALYEEQARFNEAAGLWQRLGRRRGEDTSHREHHLLVAAAQAALGRDDLDSAKQLLKAAQKHEESAHFFAAAAELAAARHNHRGAKDRLTQALVADPALAPHLLPGLIAAEQGLAEREAPDDRARHDDDELDDDAVVPATPRLAARAAGQLAAASTLELEAGAPRPLAATTPTLGAGAEALGADAPLVVGATTLATTATPGAAPSRLGAGATAHAGVATPPLEAGGPPQVAAGSAPVATTSTAELMAAAPPLEATTTTIPGATQASPSVGPALARATSRAQPPPTALSGREAAQPSPFAEVRASSRTTPPRMSSASGDDNPQTLSPSVVAGVLAALAEVEAQTGPRLELALIQAQLVPPADAAARAELAHQLTARFPASLAARVATARLALASDELAVVRGALAGLVSDQGAVAWALRGRWQCAHCGNRPGPFSWRCGQCRRWNTLRMETGIEPPPQPPRERRGAPRAARPDALLGASPVEALPTATLDPGLSDADLATAGVRRSLLGRVGGWVSGAWRRDAS